MGRKAGYFQPTTTPSARSKTLHHLTVGSITSMRRLAAGGPLESNPDDWNRKVSDEDRALTAARHRVEDLRMARELGINLEDL